MQISPCLLLELDPSDGVHGWSPAVARMGYPSPPAHFYTVGPAFLLSEGLLPNSSYQTRDPMCPFL